MCETKTCIKCGQEKPKTTEFFYLRKTSKDGYYNKCKKCLLEYDKQYRDSNKEVLLEYRIGYKENNKDVIREKDKVRYNINREVILSKKKEYNNHNNEAIKIKALKRREQNREKLALEAREYRKRVEETLRLKYSSSEYKDKKKRYVKENAYRFKEYRKQWRLQNKDKAVAIRQRRRTKAKSLPSTLTIAQWEDAKLHFNNKCAYCGKEKPLSQDHFIALSNGGGYTKDNIVCVCKSCNSSKNNKNFFEWYPEQAFYSKSREKKILKYLNYYNNKMQQLALII